MGMESILEGVDAIDGGADIMMIGALWTDLSDDDDDEDEEDEDDEDEEDDDGAGLSMIIPEVEVGGGKVMNDDDEDHEERGVIG